LLFTILIFTIYYLFKVNSVPCLRPPEKPNGGQGWQASEKEIFSLFNVIPRTGWLLYYSFPGRRSFLTLPRAIDMSPFQGEDNSF
jgi:hypothetical protein